MYGIKTGKGLANYKLIYGNREYIFYFGQYKL